jgi:hypothetical protein
LRHVLRKADEHARAQGWDPQVLLQMRLYPDMFPLLRQVQIATDMAKNAMARLAGVEPLRFEDDKTAFAQLDARIERAIAHIGGFTPDQLEGSATRPVTVPTRSRGDLHFLGRDYLFGWTIPNLYFHIATAYGLLRHAGVPLGKADFLGPVGTGPVR